ncbi:uncharacterized protein SPSK_03794 [Sporothrix schenckii 1099-18]|uniref:Uncharacterized protein n=1 Tax=Sporothrix schenckii 1099-18 TaxID=1397361 RepID=A0A0F2M188_SPOSC|nr:uncharacterized protein SPSK_03794 [Sporothrix schenckii 1099-18]KJR82515.1 hypothetical protein SPSK_03794 [Sporothrix schenckii 1099-18]
MQARTSRNGQRVSCNTSRHPVQWHVYVVVTLHVHKNTIAACPAHTTCWRSAQGLDPTDPGPGTHAKAVRVGRADVEGGGAEIGEGA